MRWLYLKSMIFLQRAGILLLAIEILKLFSVSIWSQNSVFSSFAASPFGPSITLKTAPGFIAAPDMIALLAQNVTPVGTPGTDTPEKKDSDLVEGRDSAPSSLRKSKLTLEDAINTALEANRGLADAVDRAEAARLSIIATQADFELRISPTGEAGLTSGSGQNPEQTVGLGVDLQKRFPIGTEMSVGPKMLKVGDSYRVGVDTDLTQPLLRGLGTEYNLSGVHSAEFADRSAQRSLYLTRVSLVLTTIAAAYEVIRQRELVRLNEESARRLQAEAEAAKVKEKIGLATQIDAYRAAIQQKQAEDNLNTAREAYRDALDNLKVLLTFPLEEEIELEAPLEYSVIRLDENKAINTALKTRVEIDQSADNIRESRRLARVAEHNILPNLDLGLKYTRFGSGNNVLETGGFGEEFWGISLSTTTDFPRTSQRIAHEQSLINIRTVIRNDTLQRDEIIREVKRELRNLRRSEKGIAIQQEQIRQARGKLALAKTKFRWGLASNFDLIEAEQELRGAQTSLLSAVLDYIVGSYRLRGALGTLLERPEYF